MFCPKCGKKSNGLCVKCYLEGSQVKFKKSEINLCSCGKVYHRGEWSPGFDKIIGSLVRQKLIIPHEIDVKRIDFEISDRNNKRIFLKIYISGKYRKETIETELDAEIKVINKTCELCGRTSGNYFEAVIQLRTQDPEYLENINNVIDGINPDFITKIESLKNGIDVYLTSQKYAREIENKFKEMGFNTKTSPKLMGKKEGRDVYRIYISVKPPRFKEGDFIEIDNKILKVVETGKNLICKDLDADMTKTISPVKVQKGELIENPDIRNAVVSSVTPGEIRILDLKNYETIELKNRFDLNSGDEIKILRFRNSSYII